MTRAIADYALIGDLQGAALVSSEGSIDWCCLPRFDSPPCFAALLGKAENGFWQVRPSESFQSTRRYLPETLVLETRFDTASGSATLTDCMPLRSDESQADVVRVVRCTSGSMDIEMHMAIRFDFGRTVPWLHRTTFGLTALSGPQALALFAPVPLQFEARMISAKFRVEAGESASFSLTYNDSLQRPRVPDDAGRLVEDTSTWWRNWVKNCNFEGPRRDSVIRSLITLKALTDRRTGGVVAAPTTSLPEAIGGRRNWDYRFCWLRDATFTLYALLSSGLEDEAKRWRDWLLRVAAGMPTQLQTIYGVGGERMLPEFEIGWLDGYAGSGPVRSGNDAHQQLQLDIYGELMDVFHVSRSEGIRASAEAWELQKTLMDFLESEWRQPDNGIWEVRGPRRHFTHSKVMAWVGLDRAVQAIERFGLPGDVEKWKKLRAEIYAEVCTRAFDGDRNTFTQSYGSRNLDGALLMIPLVGFLPATDPRVVGTRTAIEKELLDHGFVRRYVPEDANDGLEGSEGAFLPCTFWLADNYVLAGDRDRAASIFDSLLGITNDVGLLSEEYDPRTGQLLGNFPQAFSHVSLVNTAHNLSTAKPAKHRASRAA
jgi:GH15 family glucan-1,4-alpha-glucosidase